MTKEAVLAVVVYATMTNEAVLAVVVYKCP